MRAAVRTRYGPPEVLSVQDVPKPTPGPRELLVRVHAATVNRTDCAILWGEPFIIRFFTGLRRPKLPSTGTDFAYVRSGQKVGNVVLEPASVIPINAKAPSKIEI